MRLFRRRELPEELVPAAEVLSFERNRGLGAAVRAGLAAGASAAEFNEGSSGE